MRTCFVYTSLVYTPTHSIFRSFTSANFPFPAPHLFWTAMSNSALSCEMRYERYFSLPFTLHVIKNASSFTQVVTGTSASLAYKCILFLMWIVFLSTKQSFDDAVFLPALDARRPGLKFHSTLNAAFQWLLWTLQLIPSRMTLGQSVFVHVKSSSAHKVISDSYKR